jgi:hypothetical protein
VRAVARLGEEATRVDWAHDSAWRFMPLVRDALGGLLLHPVDLAINKVLALAGRDEPRDLTEPFDLGRGKETWLGALGDAETFVRGRPPEESGCLYYSARLQHFVVPRQDASLGEQGIVSHFGTPGGILPRMADTSIEAIG